MNAASELAAAGPTLALAGVATNEQPAHRRPVYVLSLRNLKSIPAQGCVSELEDVFAEVLSAIVFAPTDASEIAGFVQRASFLRADLFVTALTASGVVGALQHAKGWRKAFHRVFAYVFDSWLSPLELARPNWRRRLSRYDRTLAQLDHLFISSMLAAEETARHYATPVSYVPLAVDTKKFGSAQPARAISVNAYGRQHPEHVRALADAYNKVSSARSLYFTSHMAIASVHDLPRHRAFFWKMLSMSSIALAYDPMRVNPDARQWRYSFVGQRWFESLAAGCVVVGFRPSCPAADELLNWQDATLECPEDTSEFMRFIDELLDDPERLDTIRVSNVRHMLAEHDWSHRIELMTAALGDDPTLAQRKRRSQLRRLSESMSVGLPVGRSTPGLG